MFLIYDLIYFLAAIVYLPVFLIRRKLHPGFARRLGFLPKGLKLDRPIWIHAVSVGEVMAVRGLLEELKKAYPRKDFVISTVTPTGNSVARNISARGDFITYLPLDFSFTVGAVLKRVKPSLFILAETELWPNLIGYLKKEGIPIIVVNARLSERSFKKYLCANFLLKNALNKINLFCVQAPRDAEKLRRLGVYEYKIRVTGNMKFDMKDYSDLKDKCPALKRKLGLKGKLLVAGSTHPGEEEAILRAYKRLLADFPDLELLIAARHPERTQEVEKLVLSSGFKTRRISRLSGPLEEGASGKTVFILDTVGQLLSFYALADIVFVGGSLAKKGGHNILEPAALGKPVLFGPQMFNFRDIADLFLENNAGILVEDEEELVPKIKALLRDPSGAEALSQNAGRLIDDNRGATAKNMLLIKEYARIPV
ncbi:MAG: 3-deoxy-D-manno-octulosonic acid transferase [Deltaproteobacteria bacterium]